MSVPDRPVILFHYPGSPYSKKVLWYLALRGIPYSQCIQPHILPRPDLLNLGIQYRRIPVLSIGRDVHLDSRLILQKLEDFAPEKPRLAAESQSPEHRLIERLFDSLSTDGGLFRHVACILLASSPILNDPRFVQDRTEFSGELAPLADIEMAWPLVWLFSAPGALPEDQVSARVFPKVYAWVERLDAAANAAGNALPKPQTLSGEQAAGIISQSAFEGGVYRVQENDEVVRSQALEEEQLVKVWPFDSGSAHKTAGRLIGLNDDEVIVETLETETLIYTQVEDI
ncbi:hypothetical protein N7532_001319 [Penicillium argentinense]|uniref:GST N-terminal domain-containing protein n=1 Tax=Penicillium argentinense TaxID=1131581 RepID=A0A9W9G276_9EURO|nr:uncharacterized protein N7532_001319 [Penicillium argentinense]KAJ5110784.1 hypothetical protein N7532_001319 [Penicillium argentinense]